MTILNRLYASSGSEAIIQTLQIKVGDTVHYICNGYEDIIATTEGGQTVTFIAGGIEISLPARNSDGTQDLKFVVGNIDGEVSTLIIDALDDLSESSLTYRNYVSDDLFAPASPPYTLKLKPGYWTAIYAQLTAGYLNVLDTAWPRNRYTLPFFPGLRYTN